MIPLADLKTQYQNIKNEIDAAIAKVLESSQFILGDEVAAFENEFAAYSGGTHGIAVNSGTSALHLALLAAGVQPGDEVITVPFTFVATVSAICYVGARPVLVDIEPQSFTMDVTQLEAAITERTKAIMPVHLFGQPADMDPILEIANRHNLVVIEDAAQAHGAEYKGRRVGSIGHMSCFSFYPGKNLGAYGEGGLLVTNDPTYADTVRMLRNWGQTKRYDHQLKGFNYRMDGIQGAILRVKLRHLDAWTDARQRHAANYNQRLADCRVQTPRVMPYTNRHIYHAYTLRLSHRDEVQEQLQQRGIQTGVHYPIPVHLQVAHTDLGYRAGDFPCSEQAANEVLSLPLYPELTETQIETVSNAVCEITGNKQSK